MNPVNRFFLAILLWPAAFYRRMGVNTQQLRCILQAKLTMDDRRPSGFNNARRQKKDKPVKLATLATMFFSALMGLFFLFSFAIGNDYVTQLSFYFSFYISVLIGSLIADFTSVLIDVRDNMIILPKHRIYRISSCRSSQNRSD